MNRYNSEYKINGGALTIKDSTYVHRLSDQVLFEFAKSKHKTNRICTVFAPRQRGKSSLMERTIDRLRSEGVYCVCSNLYELGEVNSDKELWKSILDDVCDQIPSSSRNFKEALNEYWSNNQDLPSAKRFTNFLLNEVLPNTANRIISIFIDEIQTLIDWQLESSFVRYMKAIAENTRDPLLERLNFVFLGVAKPSDFVTRDGAILNIGEQIDIGYLSGDCKPLQQGLFKITNDTQKAIKRILQHTNGLPFLTQYICHQVVLEFSEDINNEPKDSFNIDSYIDDIVQKKVIYNWRSEDKQKHFESIENSFLRASGLQRKLKLEEVRLYKKILQGQKIDLDKNKTCHLDLMVTGLVRKENIEYRSILGVTCPIYKNVFGQYWVEEMERRLVQQLGLPSSANFVESDAPIPKNSLTNLSQFIKEKYTDMNSNIQIKEILATRKPIVERIKQVESHLQRTKDSLTALEEFQQKISEQANLTLIPSANQLNISIVKSMIADELANLLKLRERWSRDYLTFGAIGFMGHGKSTLLQNISGLTNKEIPARTGDACTAVCSTIYFHQGPTSATIKFHTEQTFLDEVVSPYYKKLKLGSSPKSLDEFSQSLPTYSGDGDATKKAMNGYLKRYQDTLPHYRNYLSNNQPKQISENKTDSISKYIAQQSDSFESFAVREVEIYCHTDREELTHVALVDIPGMGDFKPVDEKLMRDALEEKVDLVFFVHRPDPFRHQWQIGDTELYNKAANALHNLPNRAFMILNYAFNNLEACQNKKNTIHQKHIDVVNCEIVNCANQNEVQQAFAQSLQYLANQLPLLDRKYAESYQDRLHQLHQILEAELAKARENFNTDLPPAENDSEKFERLFEEFWSKLTESLESLRSRLNYYTEDEQEAKFKAQIDKLIQQCNDNKTVPSQEEDKIENSIKEVRKRFNKIGDWPATYSFYLNDVRTNLTKNFHSMDNDLKETVEEAKSLIKDIFINQGLLGELIDTNISSSQFLQEISERILSRPSSAGLKQAFTTLSEFEMSYRSNFHYRIRPLLSKLNPNTCPLQISTIKNKEDEKKEEVKIQKAQEIIEYLNVLYDETVFECEQALKGLYSEPSQAAFAEVEAFIDQVLRAKDIQKQWRTVLGNNKNLVWPQEYGSGIESYSSEEWNTLVAAAENALQPEHFQFLN